MRSNEEMKLSARGASGRALRAVQKRQLGSAWSGRNLSPVRYLAVEQESLVQVAEYHRHLAREERHCQTGRHGTAFNDGSEYTK